jgi:hypothetical protein
MFTICVATPFFIGGRRRGHWPGTFQRTRRNGANGVLPFKLLVMMELFVCRPVRSPPKESRRKCFFQWSNAICRKHGQINMYSSVGCGVAVDILGFALYAVVRFGHPRHHHLRNCESRWLEKCENRSRGSRAKREKLFLIWQKWGAPEGGHLGRVTEGAMVWTPLAE